MNFIFIFFSGGQTLDLEHSYIFFLCHTMWAGGNTFILSVPSCRFIFKIEYIRIEYVLP